MIISSPNHCWCCHTEQHTAFPTGTSQPPSCPQFLPYHHLPRKLNPPKRELDFDCTVVVWLLKEYKQSWGRHFPEYKFPLFLVLCSQINGKRSGSRSTVLLENLFTPATKISKPCQNRHWNMITWVPRWRKFPAVTMAAEKGRPRAALPSPMEPTACLSGYYLITYTFKSPLFHQLNEFCCWTL